MTIRSACFLFVYFLSLSGARADYGPCTLKVAGRSYDVSPLRKNDGIGYSFVTGLDTWYTDLCAYVWQDKLGCITDNAASALRRHAFTDPKYKPMCVKLASGVQNVTLLNQSNPDGGFVINMFSGVGCVIGGKISGMQVAVKFPCPPTIAGYTGLAAVNVPDGCHYEFEFASALNCPTKVGESEVDTVPLETNQPALINNGGDSSETAAVLQEAFAAVEEVLNG